MKKLAILFFIVLLSGCVVKVGEFTPERHAQHEVGKPNCEKTPDKCIHGVPW